MTPNVQAAFAKLVEAVEEDLSKTDAAEVLEEEVEIHRERIKQLETEVATKDKCVYYWRREAQEARKRASKFYNLYWYLQLEGEPYPGDKKNEPTRT